MLGFTTLMLEELCLPVRCTPISVTYSVLQISKPLPCPKPGVGRYVLPILCPPLVPSPSAWLDSLPQCCYPMPLAIIDGVFRDKPGLPTAQLVAGVTEIHRGVSLGAGQDV